MAKKKIVFEETTRTIDESTGELLTTTNKQVSFADKEPDYVKLYISDIVRLKDLPPSADKVLMEIIGQMGYSNIFAAYAPIKRVMIKNLDISMNTLNKSIDQLHKKGILIRIERGVYLVDPNLFARGSWDDIKNIRLTIEYDGTTGQKKLTSDAPEKLKQLQIHF